MIKNKPHKVSSDLDHGSTEEFYSYYASESVSDATMHRLINIRETVLRVLGTKTQNELKIADIGCGAGTLSRLWSDLGYNVSGIDINKPLIDLAKSRAKENNQVIDYSIGSATNLPWESGAMDVCLVPELLEHVKEWRECLDEFARILSSGGVLYLSTTNKLRSEERRVGKECRSRWWPDH